MSTILLAWELGQGLGHLSNLRPLANGLKERGHEVVVALRDLSRAHLAFAGVDVTYVQAPIKVSKAKGYVVRPRSFTDILHNNGFGNAVELGCMVRAWRSLFKQFRVDVVVCEHSPTPLLASRGCDARCVLLGHGFYRPPDVHPLPDLRPWLGDSVEYRTRADKQVLGSVNTALQSLGVEPLERLGQLFSQADENFLLTFPELDNYQDPDRGQYVGGIAELPGKPPRWPAGSGSKVFAYLRPIPAMSELLACLREMSVPAIIFCPGLAPDLRQRFQSAKVKFENHPLDMQIACRECDLAILNGGHGTTVSMLTAGKPVFVLPIFLEQRLTAMAVDRLGVGLNSPIEQGGRAASALRSMVSNEEFIRSAGSFARQKAGLDPRRQLNRVLDCIEDLALK